METAPFTVLRIAVPRGADFGVPRRPDLPAPRWVTLAARRFAPLGDEARGERVLAVRDFLAAEVPEAGFFLVDGTGFCDPLVFGDADLRFFDAGILLAIIFCTVK